jgi:predicted lipoprotein with Yx(FWY)xxD motif
MIWNAEIAATKANSRRRWTKRSRRIALSGFASIALAGAVAACGSGGLYGGGQPTHAATGQRPAASHGNAVTARQLPGVGMVLVDRSGKTIYSPRQEANGMIHCTGSCLGFWFPVTVAAGTTPHDGPGMSGTLSTIRRSDNGQSQLTYNGRPLYTFRLDQGPGELHGNNFSDQFGGTSFMWQVVSASGATAASTHSAKPSSGYSYPAGGSYGN